MLSEHFGLVVDKTLHEWCQVRESIADSGLAADKAMEWVTTNLNVSHTNLFKLAAVGLLIPTSTSGENNNNYKYKSNHTNYSVTKFQILNKTKIKQLLTFCNVNNITLFFLFLF